MSETLVEPEEITLTPAAAERIKNQLSKRGSGIAVDF